MKTIKKKKKIRNKKTVNCKNVDLVEGFFFFFLNDLVEGFKL